MKREEAIKEWIIPALKNTWNEKKNAEILKALEQEHCIQEKQANADKIDAVYIDGFKAGYSQARFDLEQETCDDADAISRQAVLDEINRIGVKAFETYDDYSELFDFVDSLPPVSTEKTGHNCNEDYADCDQFICSECGIELQDWNRVERDEDDGEISYHEYTFNYCPNCGAKMQEVE